MIPNGYQALYYHLHDGGLVHEFYPIRIEDGVIVSVWPEPDFALLSMGDATERARWIREAQKRGSVEAESFWARLGE